MPCRMPITHGPATDKVLALCSWLGFALHCHLHHWSHVHLWEAGILVSWWSTLLHSRKPHPCPRPKTHETTNQDYYPRCARCIHHHIAETTPPWRMSCTPHLKLSLWYTLKEQLMAR